jgi:hypothetical protein
MNRLLTDNDDLILEKKSNIKRALTLANKNRLSEIDNSLNSSMYDFPSEEKPIEKSDAII